MPKRLPTDLLERAKAALDQHPDGLTLADLEALLQGAISRRSLQRRLDEWLLQRAIRAEGERRGRRSSSRPSGPQVIVPTGQLAIAAKLPAVQEGIQLSIAGQEIQALVRRPIADRAPIGFYRAFLEDYVPNQTPYLSETLTLICMSWGARRKNGCRPARTHATSWIAC